MPDTTFNCEISKVDEGLGLVFGFAIVCKENGVDHYDLQGHHIPEAVMLEAVTEFSKAEMVAKDMHRGDQIGEVAFLFPLTAEVAKAFDITSTKTGLMIAMRPGADVLAKFASKEYTGFSIGGKGTLEEVAA